MRTQADFREMVEKRRLTHADEIYHEWVEQVFKERDEARAHNKELCNANIKWSKAYNDLRAQLSQRRDFTLTARKLAERPYWDVVDATGHIVLNQTYEALARRLERWSREGLTAETAEVIFAGGTTTGVVQPDDCDRSTASSRICERGTKFCPIHHNPRDRAAQLLQPLLYFGLTREPPPIERVREVMDAIIKAVREVK